VSLSRHDPCTDLLIINYWLVYVYVTHAQFYSLTSFYNRVANKTHTLAVFQLVCLWYQSTWLRHSPRCAHVLW